MINLHIVRNTVRNDSRVLKEAATLQASGLFSAVEIVGLNEPGLPEVERIAGITVRRITLGTRGWSKGLVSQALKFAEWRQRIVRAYRGQPLSVIHCHDLDPLPIAVRLKQSTGARLVYDAHELETEQGESSRIRVALSRATERMLIGRADAVITVSESIVDWYRGTYPGISPALVRNVPVRPGTPIEKVDLRRICGVPDDALLFIYLGALSVGRGIEELLTAFTSSGVRHHIVFMGYGSLAEVVKSRSLACERIHYHPPVPPADVLRFAAGADVGVSMIMDRCLSNRYCLPNKLFECVLADLPVLVSDIPEQRKFVETYQAGWCTATDHSSIVSTVRAISRGECTRVREGLASRTGALGWHQEAEVLLRVYRRALGVPQPDPAG
jgi:glycosyltransferase involved in cell wall biosynthesis